MTLQSRKSVPNPYLNYSMQLTYDGADLSPYVNQVRIINTVDSVWPQVIFTVSLEAKMMIDEDIYGQKTFELVIYRYAEDTNVKERVTYYLMYAEGNATLYPSGAFDTSGSDKQTITITTVPIYAVNTMGCFVNAIVDENVTADAISGLSPVDLLKQIVSDFGFTNAEISDQNKNNDPITQCIIPPMSLNQCIDFLNNNFLLYDNATLYKSCDKDGKLLVTSLFNSFTRAEIARINLLANDTVNEDYYKKVIEEADDTNVYVKTFVESVFHSNANIMKYGYNTVIVQKPTENLFSLTHQSIDDLSKKQIKYNSFLRSRKRYYTDTQSFTDKYIEERMGQSFIRMSRLKMTISGNIPLDTFSATGDIVRFKVGPMMQYQKYQGKYILGTSDLILIRDGYNWSASCILSMFRPFQQSDDSRPIT